MPSSNPTPDGKSRLRIKSRRESKIGTLKVEKGSLEDNKDFMVRIKIFFKILKWNNNNNNQESKGIRNGR